MATALTLLAVALLLLPGWALWTRLVRPQPTLEAGITGLSFATGVALLALYVLAYAGLNYFLAAWLLLGLVQLRPRRAWRAAAAWREWLPRLSVHRSLLLLTALAAGVRFLPTFFQDYPPGWDPNFHLLVVRLIEEQWALVTSLSPFEDIPINYPTGTHLLIALIAKCTGAARYDVYQAILALFGTLTCLQIYAWVHAATGDRRWSLYAMAAYALLAMQGSLAYYEWGGIPNLVGMYLLTGCLTIVIQQEAGERRWWALPPMYLAIAVVHHHVLIMAFAVMAVLLGYLALHPARRADGRRLLLGGVVAALVGVPYLVRHFSGHGIHETGLLEFEEPANTLWVIVRGFGFVFSLAVAAGAVCYARDFRARPLRAELLLATLAMLAVFVLFEHGGPLVMAELYGKPIAPLTPSRFITDAVYPLSAFAGLAFLEVERRLGGRGLLPAVGLLFLTNLPAYAEYFTPVMEPYRRAAYLWVEANTRPDTLVIDPYIQAPVLTHRTASYTALPSSELWARAGKRALLERIIDARTPVADAGAPVIIITHGQRALVPPEAILLQHGNGFIVDLNPRLSARLR